MQSLVIPLSLQAGEKKQLAAVLQYILLRQEKLHLVEQSRGAGSAGSAKGRGRGVIDA